MFKEDIKSEDKPENELLEHACDICPRTFKTLPGLKRHKTSHSRKPQENKSNLNYKFIFYHYFNCLIFFQLLLIKLLKKK